MNQIALFLHEMKGIVSERGFIFVERDASLQFMADHNISMDQLEAVILGLEPSDCFDGPEPDRDPRYSMHWTVAEFSPEAFGETLYLKMSIRMDARRCKCLSVKLYKGASEVER